MLSCAAIQKLERYGYLGLKRHSTEDFTSTSVKDPKRTNIYALTQLETWQEAVQAIRGDAVVPSDPEAASPTAAPARFSEALVYAMSFAVALTTQHVLEVSIALDAKASATAAVAPSTRSNIFTSRYDEAQALLTTLKELAVAIGGGRALRSNAASDDFTKAVAHLLTNVVDCALVLLATTATTSGSTKNTVEAEKRAELLASVLVLAATTAQTLRRVQAAFPVSDLFNARPCSALLKQVANKQKQQQQQQAKGESKTPSKQKRDAVVAHAEEDESSSPPLLRLLSDYIDACTEASHAANSSFSSCCAAGLFPVFSLFQRLGLLHGALGAVVTASTPFPDAIRGAAAQVQRWFSQLLSATACNRATRYVVYFREDELRLMQHNIRQATEYALYTCTTTPPIDPGLVEPLLGVETDIAGTPGLVEGSAASTPMAAFTKKPTTTVERIASARAALVLAQWCVSAPFFFESFCQDENWASFAQEQRRRVLLQQVRARRGLEKSTKTNRSRNGEDDEQQSRTASRSSSASSVSSSTSSLRSRASANGKARDGTTDVDTTSLLSMELASHTGGAGSVTSLASRVSLLSTLSKHSAASYLSFISLLQPSAAGTANGEGVNGEKETAVERQMHESEDGNTNLPLILLEQLTLGLHQFMEAYPVELLDAHGLRSVTWDSIARLFAFVESTLSRRPVSSVVAVVAGGAPAQPIFNLAQDLRYNKGMGYECLGVLFAKVVAPLLDITDGATSGDPPVEAEKTLPVAVTRKPECIAAKPGSDGEDEDMEDVRASEADEGRSSVNSDGGDRTEAGFFASTAIATVGRAVLSTTDAVQTRTQVETALSMCLTAYETVAPQVVDMNLPTILRLTARTAVRAEEDGVTETGTNATAANGAQESGSSHLHVYLDFLCAITSRLGRSNELPHLLDAMLGRDEESRKRHQQQQKSEVQATGREEDVEELAAVRSVRHVFDLPQLRSALADAAGMSLDPESVLQHLSTIAMELDDRTTTTAQEEGVPTPLWMEETLLTLEVVETVLTGVLPTSVSSGAVLEQTTQLELLLTSAFMACVHVRENKTEEGSRSRRTCRQMLLQLAYTIRQCRTVTVGCLQDLGTQHVHEYLNMLDETLWQLSSEVGQLLGSCTLTELQPLFVTDNKSADGDAGDQTAQLMVSSSSSSAETTRATLLLPSLVLQRLSLARTVSAALGTTAGPAPQLHIMVRYLHGCLSGNNMNSESCKDVSDAVLALLVANGMTGDDWMSLVAFGKEKHTRAAMVALLKFSASVETVTKQGAPSSTATWVRCALRAIPGAILRALVDVYVSLDAEELCEAARTSLLSFGAAATNEESTCARLCQWTTVLTTLEESYYTLGHNPYWPSLLTHTVRATAQLAKTWRRANKSVGSRHTEKTEPVEQTVSQLTSLLLCVLRSEPRAAEVLRAALIAQMRQTTSTPALSRSGMSVDYVKALKVPAATIGDLSAPAELIAAVAVATTNGEEENPADDATAQVAALAELTFEEEINEVCTALFDSSFVKATFTLVELQAQTSNASVPSLGGAASDACVRACALLYQVAVSAAQVGWRAKATGGSLEALRETAALRMQLCITETFHARLRHASSVGDATQDEEKSGSDLMRSRTMAALLVFLSEFHAKSGGSVGAEQLFVHIAVSNKTDASSSGGTAVDGENGQKGEEAVEHLWQDILRVCACDVLRLAKTSSHALPLPCRLLRVLLTHLHTSTQEKLQHMPRGVSSGNSRVIAGTAQNGKRSRQDRKNSSKTYTGAEAVTSALPAISAGVKTLLENGLEHPAGHAAVAMEVLLRDVLTSPTGAKPEFAEHAQQLCQLLSASCATEAAANDGVHLWRSLTTAAGAGGWAALWIVWKLFCVSMTVASSAASSASDIASRQEEALQHTRQQLQTFLDSVGATAQVSRLSFSKAHTEQQMAALQGVSFVFATLPTEAAPPLLLDHLHRLLHDSIPTTPVRTDVAVSGTVAQVRLAADLLLQLLRLRPRLPAWRLLPHAQRFIVYLAQRDTQVTLRGAFSSCDNERVAHKHAGASLVSLGLRLCSAVAEHPLVAGIRSNKEPAVVAAVKPPNSNAVEDVMSCVPGELLDGVWSLLLSLAEVQQFPSVSVSSSNTTGDTSLLLLREREAVQLLLLLTQTWLRAPHEVLWSRPAVLPLVLSAVFTAVMRGMDAGRYGARVLNVLAGGLTMLAADVEAAAASAVAEDAVDPLSDEEVEGDTESPAVKKLKSDGASPAELNTPRGRKRSASNGVSAAAPVPARVKCMALAATTSVLFQVAQHHVHIFTAFSSEMDFLFTDFLRVLSGNFLPKVTRPPIAYHAGVQINGTTQSDMSFADLAYMCVGNEESKSLLKQAALRMEEEDGGVAALTDGSRSIFRVV